MCSRMVWAARRGGCPCWGQWPAARHGVAGMLLCKSVFAQRPAGGGWCRADGISQGPAVNICCSRRTSGAAWQDYQQPWRWQSRLCAVMGGEWSNVGQWGPAPSLPRCSDISGGVYSRYKTFRVYIFLEHFLFEPGSMLHI